jgi:serine/threonine protein kinase
MLTMKFSTKTDVWAFGIVLLEMADNGRLPLHRLVNAEVLVQVPSGYMSPKPDTCSESMYKVMRSCWDMSPDNRPTFAELVATLSDQSFLSAEKTKVASSMRRQQSVMGQTPAELQDSGGYLVPEKMGNNVPGTTNVPAVYLAPERGRNSATNDAQYVVQGNAAAQAKAQNNQPMYAAPGSPTQDAGYLHAGPATAGGGGANSMNLYNQQGFISQVASDGLDQNTDDATGFAGVDFG